MTRRDPNVSAEGFLLRLPKVELHVHLEGTFRPATLLHLAKKNGVTLPADDEAGIRRWFRFPTFEQFIEIYVTCSKCLVDPEDFKLLALDFLAEQAVQNVLWSEVHFTISTHLANGRNGEEIHAALMEAIAEGKKRWGVGMALIPDVVRNYDVPRADWTLRWAVDHKDEGVVAMGIGGMEKGLTNLPFASHFVTFGASPCGLKNLLTSLNVALHFDQFRDRGQRLAVQCRRQRNVFRRFRSNRLVVGTQQDIRNREL